MRYCHLEMEVVEGENEDDDCQVMTLWHLLNMNVEFLKKLSTIRFEISNLMGCEGFPENSSERILSIKFMLNAIHFSPLQMQHSTKLKWANN